MECMKVCARLREIDMKPGGSQSKSSFCHTHAATSASQQARELRPFPIDNTGSNRCSNSSPGQITMAQFSALVRDTKCAGKGLPISDDMLVAAAQAGQEWAFVELCSRHSRRLLYTVYRITKNREDAED